MNRELLEVIFAEWADPLNDEFARLDQALRPRRGPRPNVTTKTVLVGLVYTNVEYKLCHLRRLARTLRQADRKCLERLGVPDPTHPPSYLQLWRFYTKLRRHLGFRQDSNDETGTKRIDKHQAAQEILDLLVPPSAGPLDATEPTSMWAIDTSYFDGWCRYVNTDLVDPTDPDATWRKIDRPNADPKTFLGYAAVAAVRANGTGPEVCDRMTLLSANEDDATPGADLAHAMRNAGLPVTTIIADRGFSQKPVRFLDPLRDKGIQVVFDLKRNDLGVFGEFNRALVVDGWLYAPGLPKRLRKLAKPGPKASDAAKRRYRDNLAERMRYAFPPHATPDTNKARVASPARRGQIRCRHVPVSTLHEDPTLPTCRAKHAPHEACGIKTMTFPASAAPRTWQWPPHGTRDWADIYKRRTAVKRFFGHLKSESTGGWRKGAYRTRRLPNVALCLALTTVATNLQLRFGPQLRT